MSEKIRDFFSYTHRENNKAYDPKHYQLENIGERYSDAPWIILATFL